MHCRNTGHARCISEIIICMFVFSFDLCSILSSHLAPNPQLFQPFTKIDLYIQADRTISANMNGFHLVSMILEGSDDLLDLACSPRWALISFKWSSNPYNLTNGRLGLFDPYKWSHNFNWSLDPFWINTVSSEKFSPK